MSDVERQLNYLPLGTIILLKGGNKRLIIVGRKQTSTESKQIFDYAGVLFPEGYQDSEHFYAFNHSDIENIFQLGLIDSEEIEYQQILNDYENN